jgi:hypothetical protein
MTQPGDNRFRYLRNDDITDRQSLEWYLDGVELDVLNYGVPQVTSSTRPDFPATGKVIYETDTERLLIYDGTEWTPPMNVAWGVDDSVTSGVGLYTLTSGNAATWTQSVTLRSDRKYLITGTITGVPSDITEAGGVDEMTRMQLTAAYNGVTFDQSRFGFEEYYWSDNATAHVNSNEVYRTVVLPVNGIVTGTGSAANITFSFADSVGRGYDFDCVSNFCRFIITDVGPA